MPECNIEGLRGLLRDLFDVLDDNKWELGSYAWDRVEAAHLALYGVSMDEQYAPPPPPPKPELTPEEVAMATKQAAIAEQVAELKEARIAAIQAVVARSIPTPSPR